MRAASYLLGRHCIVNQEEDYEVINRIARRSQESGVRSEEVGRRVDGAGGIREDEVRIEGGRGLSHAC